MQSRLNDIRNKRSSLSIDTGAVSMLLNQSKIEQNSMEALLEESLTPAEITLSEKQSLCVNQYSG